MKVLSMETRLSNKPNVNQKDRLGKSIYFNFTTAVLKGITNSDSIKHMKFKC